MSTECSVILLEVSRCADIVPVRVKSPERQALQGLHRTRSLWMSTQTSCINALRGFCREFGLTVTVGSRTGVEAMGQAPTDPESAIPLLIRSSKLLIDEPRIVLAPAVQDGRVVGSALLEHPQD